ncbi:MAG: tauD [Actinomycetia bacterium]|nr:tauD [Actinomycetes bacterium]
MELEALSPAIGAIVHGVDLREPLSGADRDGIHDALMAHLVVFFRDQPLTQEQQLAFAANFGEPVPGSAAAPEDDPDRWFVVLEDGPDAEPKSDRWHTDVPFSPTPPDIAVLTMLAPAPVGGDTMWLSLNAVWDGLSPVMQDLLAPLELEFDMGPSKLAARELYGEEFYRQLLANEPVARHPLVRIHPVTGRPAVYLGGAFMRGIAGMHVEESDALLGFLQSRLHDPNLQVRWRWRQHDVAMWDERCTNHRGLSDHYPAHRLVRRCVVGEGVPMGPMPRT